MNYKALTPEIGTVADLIIKPCHLKHTPSKIVVARRTEPGKWEGIQGTYSDKQVISWTPKSIKLDKLVRV